MYIDSINNIRHLAGALQDSRNGKGNNYRYIGAYAGRDRIDSASHAC